MSISYIIRLRPDALSEGRFVGEVEAVSSTERRAVRTLDQIAAFILETRQHQADESDRGGWTENRAL